MRLQLEDERKRHRDMKQMFDDTLNKMVENHHRQNRHAFSAEAIEL